MIERFSLKADVSDIVEQFKARKVIQSINQRFNVAPTSHISIVMNDRHQQRIVHEARWGMFPFWAKDSINTTKADIRRKPFLLELAQRNRCIIPCTGFYGAKQIGQERDPRAMHIVMTGKPLFGIAGIFDRFRNAQGREYHVFTMLTEENVGHMSDWQSTLPIVLDEEGIEAWLNPKERNYEFLQMHLPRLEGYQLRAYPVTNEVHNDMYDSPECIRELKIDFA